MNRRQLRARLAAVEAERDTARAELASRERVIAALLLKHDADMTNVNETWGRTLVRSERRAGRVA